MKVHIDFNLYSQKSTSKTAVGADQHTVKEKNQN